VLTCCFDPNAAWSTDLSPVLSPDAPKRGSSRGRSRVSFARSLQVLEARYMQGERVDGRLVSAWNQLLGRAHSWSVYEAISTNNYRGMVSVAVRMCFG